MSSDYINNILDRLEKMDDDILKEDNFATVSNY